MVINKLIEQIGRERLEVLSKAENLPELQKLAQFALAALDAKPVIYEAEINGIMSSVTKSHYDDCKRFGVPVRELYTTQPAASVPKWVKCSEQMPNPRTGVLVAAPCESAPGGYAMKWATRIQGHPDAIQDEWLIPGASWMPTHWMALPAAPDPGQ